MAAELLCAGVEHNEVVDQFEKARLAAQLDQSAVQRVFDRAVFFPSEVIFLRRLDRAVTQALGVVASHDQLHGGEEVLDENLLLVVEVLADAFGHGNRRAFQLQHAERDTVDIEDHIRAFAVRLGIGCRTVTSSAMAK